VIDATLATTIGLEGVRVSTVEHLMAAFAGVGVDNAEVELDAAEVPIMDGSSEPFNALLKNAGIQVQDKPKKFVIVKHPVTVIDGTVRPPFFPAVISSCPIPSTSGIPSSPTSFTSSRSRTATSSGKSAGPGLSVF